MKKSIFIIFLATILSITNTNGQNSWADEGLKGYALMVKQRCHEVISTANGTQKGAITQCIVPNEDYTYDSRGRCTEAAGYGTDNKMEWKATYTYKPSDKKAEMILKNATGVTQSKTEYIYDNADNVIEERLYNSMGDLQEKIVHEYDGMLRKVTFCYRAQGDLRWRETYEYDRLGNITGYKHYDRQGKLDWQTIYKYNNAGVKIEEGTYDSANNELSHNFYEYVFDDNDNWIQQTVFTYDLNKNKIPENIISRDITYY